MSGFNPDEMDGEKKSLCTFCTICTIEGKVQKVQIVQCKNL